MEYIVGIGEYIISTNNEDIVKTFALSTCVAMVIYDQNKKILAMAHVLLPNASTDVDDEAHRTAKYADRAVYNVINEMKLKYNCNLKDFKISLYGGVDSEVEDRFKVGERNLAVIKEILNDMNLRYEIVNTGGRVSRTLIAHTATGEVEVKSIPIQGVFS
jgi:chemotaxis protein CheD